jgi:hypothetical protein
MAKRKLTADQVLQEIVVVLAESDGETIEEIANQVFADNPFRFVGHDPRTGDIVFEQKI